MQSHHNDSLSLSLGNTFYGLRRVPPFPIYLKLNRIPSTGGNQPDPISNAPRVRSGWSLMAARIRSKYPLFGSLVVATSRITNWCGYAIFSTSNALSPKATPQEKPVYHPLGTTPTTRAVLGHRCDTHEFACEGFAPLVFGRGIRGSRTGPQRTEKTRWSTDGKSRDETRN